MMFVISFSEANPDALLSRLNYKRKIKAEDHSDLESDKDRVMERKLWKRHFLLGDAFTDEKGIFHPEQIGMFEILTNRKMTEGEFLEYEEFCELVDEYNEQNDFKISYNLKDYIAGERPKNRRGKALR